MRSDCAPLRMAYPEGLAGSASAARSTSPASETATDSDTRIIPNQSIHSLDTMALCSGIDAWQSCVRPRYSNYKCNSGPLCTNEWLRTDVASGTISSSRSSTSPRRTLPESPLIRSGRKFGWIPSRISDFRVVAEEQALDLDEPNSPQPRPCSTKSMVELMTSSWAQSRSKVRKIRRIQLSGASARACDTTKNYRSYLDRPCRFHGFGRTSRCHNAPALLRLRHAHTVTAIPRLSRRTCAPRNRAMCPSDRCRRLSDTVEPLHRP